MDTMVTSRNLQIFSNTRIEEGQNLVLRNVFADLKQYVRSSAGRAPNLGAAGRLISLVVWSKTLPRKETMGAEEYLPPLAVTGLSLVSYLAFCACSNSQAFFPAPRSSAARRLRVACLC
jgi:hypothetical protein